jgi:hypothetical protein
VMSQFHLEVPHINSNQTLLRFIVLVAVNIKTTDSHQCFRGTNTSIFRRKAEGIRFFPKCP